MIDLIEEAIGAEVHPSMPVDDAARARRPARRRRATRRWGSGKIIEELFEATAESVADRSRRSSPAIRWRSRPLARTDRNDPFLTERFELFVGRPRAGQRVQRAQRSGRATGPLRGRAGRARGRRRRSRHGRRGLPARPRVRHAADRRARHRHGPRGHAARRCVIRSRKSSCSRRCARRCM